MPSDDEKLIADLDHKGWENAADRLRELSEVNAAHEKALDWSHDEMCKMEKRIADLEAGLRDARRLTHEYINLRVGMSGLHATANQLLSPESAETGSALPSVGSPGGTASSVPDTQEPDLGPPRQDVRDNQALELAAGACCPRDPAGLDSEPLARAVVAEPDAIQQHGQGLGDSAAPVDTAALRASLEPSQGITRGLTIGESRRVLDALDAANQQLVLLVPVRDDDSNVTECAECRADNRGAIVRGLCQRCAASALDAERREVENWYDVARTAEDRADDLREKLAAAEADLALAHGDTVRRALVQMQTRAEQAERERDEARALLEGLPTWGSYKWAGAAESVRRKLREDAAQIVSLMQERDEARADNERLRGLI